MARKPSTDAPVGTDSLFDLMDSEFGKKFKKNPAQRLSDYRKDIPKLWYSTGIMTLDIALGGGLAGGRVSEIYGLEGSGKSTTLYSAIAEAQRRHPEGFHDYHIIADPENSSSDARKHMEKIGVDTSKVHIIAPTDGQPLYAEDIGERIEWLLRHPQLKGRIGLIGVDSVGALVSRFEGENDKKWDKAARVGGISNFMSIFLRNVVDSGLLYEADAHLLLLNQVRDAIGAGQYEPQFRTPGGRKVAFTAAQRLEVTRTRGADFANPNYNHTKENSGEAQYTGQKIKFRQIKSKVGGKDGATASIVFLYDEGLDVALNAIQVAQQHEMVVGSGWLSLIDVATGQEVVKKQGLANFKNALLEDEELYAKFDYMLTCVLRGIEPKSVVDEWDEIKATEIDLGETGDALVENPE
jgi:RecA/RadA recombinase